MANKITTRAALIDWIKIELGEPVIRVNVAPEQINQQIDKALQYFWEWHRDGSKEIYLVKTVQAVDVTNRYIAMPDNIDDVVQIFPKKDYLTNDSFATVEWQMTSSIWSPEQSFYMISAVDYMLSLQSISNIEAVTGSNVKAFVFEKYTRKLFPLFPYLEGEVLMIKAYKNLDPEDDADAAEAFNDPWFKEYATNLVKMVWGNNLKKFAGVRLPGNIDLNGQQIFDEAMQEKQRLEDVLKNEHQEPPMFFVG